jgi:hypothetical protein
MPSTPARTPFHESAEDIGGFNAFYDERERRERAGRRLEVVGPSENTD